MPTTLQQITDGNRLIAEFMGWTSDANGWLTKTEDRTDDEGNEHTSSISLKGLPYDKDWNLICEVIKKIALVDIPRIDLGYQQGKVLTLPLPLNKVDTYNALLVFITWYNKAAKIGNASKAYMAEKADFSKAVQSAQPKRTAAFAPELGAGYNTTANPETL